ncbi:hypothetical protein DMT42_23165 [Streptomyces actuosus]|uniref:Uncharacterized protein n=1 Tax=Streptomyces actuosus TaxID=1885 RepID=A0A2U9P5V4_STRAS|nr:hypothetical protein DMT42_23165 [Streptomyces actuosus]
MVSSALAAFLCRHSSTAAGNQQKCKRAGILDSRKTRCIASEARAAGNARSKLPSTWKGFPVDAAHLSDLDIDALEISEFLDESRLEDSEVVAKVMSASCTTCECCCSCSS